MPSPPLLNFEELLAPIPGENPAGGEVPFDVREKLEEWRKEIDPGSWSPDDPTRPAEFKKADWRSIVGLAQETLANTSKDLLITARLLEAMTREHGFAGLRDGLQLFRLLIEQAWARLKPEIETEVDLEVRAAPFFWLDEKDRGARFPVSVHAVPLLAGDEGPLSWQDWKRCANWQGEGHGGRFREGDPGRIAGTLSDGVR